MSDLGWQFIFMLWTILQGILIVLTDVFHNAGVLLIKSGSVVRRFIYAAKLLHLIKIILLVDEADNRSM